MPRRRSEMQRDVWTRIVLAWITCVCFGSSAPFVNQSRSLETSQSSESETSQLEGRHVLHRAKRGWVWNQMFVLEEFSGPDPILVGRVSAFVVSWMLSLLITSKKHVGFCFMSVCPVGVLGNEVEKKLAWNSPTTD